MNGSFCNKEAATAFGIELQLEAEYILTYGHPKYKFRLFHCLQAPSAPLPHTFAPSKVEINS